MEPCSYTILFAGGDTNLYGYVLQNPVNFIDTTGKFPQLAVRIFAVLAVWLNVELTGETYTRTGAFRPGKSNDTRLDMYIDGDSKYYKPENIQQMQYFLKFRNLKFMSPADYHDWRIKNDPYKKQVCQWS